MTAIWQINNHQETRGYDFLNASSVIRLVHGSIKDQTTENEEPVEISFQTVANGTTTQIRQAIRDIERLLAQATMWLEDETDDESIWLHAASVSETERRVLILGWTRSDESQDIGSDPLLDDVTQVISTWVITRAPFWEGLVSAATNYDLWTKLNKGGFYEGSTMPATGLKGFDHIANTSMNKGTAPGRIIEATLDMWAGTGDDIDRYWIGIKVTKKNLISNFWRPFMPMSRTYNWTLAIDVTNTYNNNLSDTAAPNDFCYQMQFNVDEEFRDKYTFYFPTYSQGTAGTNFEWEHYRGRYKLLYMLRVDAASTECRVAAFLTWDSTTFWSSGGLRVADHMQDVYISDQYYHWYDMGTVQLPPEGYRHQRRQTYPEIGDLQFGLSAGRLTGSGNLRAAMAVLVPMDHFISGEIPKGQDTSMHGSIFTDELDNIVAQTHKYQGSPTERYMHEVAANNWRWPVAPLSTQEGMVVVVMDEPFSSNAHTPFAEEAILSMKVVPRYLSYNAD